ncbi:MAG: hypothetical protein FWH28_05160 [Clostridiales bacterium]|nr:hypothetical protein [Clostridiales bacterium]
MKKSIVNQKTIGAFFLLVLVLLLFSSRTIYSYNLPQVNAVKPENGRLSKLEMSAGILSWAEIQQVYAAVGGVYGEILAQEGDVVEAGQPLFRMEYDREETERRLREIAATRAKLEIDLQHLDLRLERLDRSIQSAGYEMDTLDKEIDLARIALEDTAALYELGALSRRDLTAKEEALDALLTRRDKTRTDLTSDSASLSLERQAKQLELSNLSLQEEPYQKALADYDAYTVVRAPASGQLLSLHAQKGARVNENALMAEIGTGQAFTLECSISLENNFVLPGDTCELSNSAHTLNATVSRVTPTDRGKTAVLSLISDVVSAGETFDVLFEKQSETSYTLIPNGALNQDNDGYFVYQVKRRDGMLGKEYYLERVNVYIGDNDSRNTAIVRGITFFEPLVLTGNKAVEAGSVVKLMNAGDFFVD